MYVRTLQLGIYSRAYCWDSYSDVGPALTSDDPTEIATIGTPRAKNSSAVLWHGFAYANAIAAFGINAAQTCFSLQELLVMPL
jgi:hypothetical protein